MLLTPHRASVRRRGVILLVVLMLLTLFCVLGLTFVLLSDSFATSARVAREAEDFTRPDVDPELAFSLVLGQVIYDLPDDADGVRSALRGHSLARNMYGWNDAAAALNDKAYAGLGRLRYPSTTFPPVSDFDLINYQFFAADGWLRDPERLGSRAPGQSRGAYVPWNVPYTYVDNNNVYLAFLNPATSTIDVPSFHRPWVFNLDPNTGQPLANPPAFNDPSHPNWTSPAGKYLTLRPRPAEMGPGFPYPQDRGGDVKNYDGGPGGCDSIWIDVNAPVMRSADGRKFKMLVAPLIVELDSRLNVNVHGNILGKNNSHAGNQGWGPWEVNLGKVLKATQTAPGPSQEWANLFLGAPGSDRVFGRYGQGRLPLRPGGFRPGAVDPLVGTMVPRGWGATDENGVVDPVTRLGPAPNAATRWTPTPAYRLPAGFGPGFPRFPAAGYNNGYPAEFTTTGTAAGTPVHPLLYDPVHPTRGNFAFPVADTVKLLRWGGTNYEFLGSDLVRLCPNNFADPLTRNLVTTTSFDLDRPAPVPYVWDRDAAPYKLGATYPYSLRQPVLTVPFAATQLADLVTARNGPQPAHSEFDGQWRSVLAKLDRVNLSRPLTPYTNPNPTTGLFAAADLAQCDAALKDRQGLARAIFDALRQAVGARDPAVGLGAAELNALRVLAQIAVNTVDFIDGDDCITPFNWFRSEWVYGVELPRLVLNEVYVQYDNDPNDPGILEGGKSSLGARATTFYNVNVWAELLNPLDGRTDLPYNSTPTGGFPNRDVAARLSNASGPVYQVVIADGAVGSVVLRVPGNVRGDPDYHAGGRSPVRAVATDFGPETAVLPVDSRYGARTASQQGFFVLGPAVDFLDGEDPNLPYTHRSPGMTYQVPVTAFGAKRPPQPTVLLRRLACPGLPPQPDATLPRYNPYVTVDYVAHTTPPAGNDARHYTNLGANTPQPLAGRRSMGRTQPYAASASQVVPQGPVPALVGQPQHTFFRHNGRGGTPPTAPDGTLQVPFDWLVHLDRAPISKSELLFVPRCKPHELTQLFADGTGANRQAAPWTDETTRLYRFFDLADVPARFSGAAPGGRIPGRINLNMVFAPEVFRAICDAQPGNRYDEAQVNQLFQQLRDYRTPAKVPGPGDRPFWGFGAGPAPGNDALSAAPRGITNQLPDLHDPAANPYERFEVLNKIANNVTTRSNVFAVWVTVGFFEVVDESTTPPKLGAEIGRSEDRHIRHRMFAIVDRTNLEVFSTTSTADVIGRPEGNAAPVQLTRMAGTVEHSGFAWNVQPGSVLVYQPNDPLGNEETVVVRADNTATFRKSHPTGCRVVSRGNPGPWAKQPYSPARDGAVVTYFAVIE